MELTLKRAEKIVGTLSEPSKLPCHSYSIPAQKCITGAKLRKVENSVCSKCYALKGNYGFPVVRKALMRRFKSLKHPLWVNAITFLIEQKEKSGFMRFFDSGDLQGTWHLQNICQVAKNLPHIQFWLPTREYGIVSEYIKGGNVIPANLTIRLSAYMIEGNPPTALAEKLNLTTSGVSKKGFTCPSSKQGNKCLDCRACWNPSVSNINYKQH